MRVVAGLGNPGPQYVWTRHNAGFLIVQRLAEKWNLTFREGGLSHDAIRRDSDGEVRLVLPQCYMNRSGEALVGLVEPPLEETLIVVYDDVDLPTGTLRIRCGGGAGGHRGVASVIDNCGSEFVRLRVGVGRPDEGRDTAEFVLAELSSAEREELMDSVDRGTDAIECLLDQDVEAAMNRFNGARA